MRTFEKVEKDPHVLFREMIQEIFLAPGKRIKQTGVPIKLSGTTGRVLIPFPELGEHTVEVWNPSGMPDMKLRNLRRMV